MKILFTLLSLEANDDEYLYSAKNLANEILEQTAHDVYISTNNTEFFSNINNSRCLVRNNIDKNSIISFPTEFNYNLKYHAFKNIPKDYDYIIYLDCDIKLQSWTEESEKFIKETVSPHEFCADRLNSVLRTEIEIYKNPEIHCIFKHKISSYNIIENYSEDHDIMNAQLPSEHFLILKNNPKKVRKFWKEWKRQNEILQAQNGGNGSWGDGFEIGISARLAGLHDTIIITSGVWSVLLGFNFNGNKYIKTK